MSDTKKERQKWFLDSPRLSHLLGGEGSYSQYLLEAKKCSEYKPIRKIIFNKLPKKWNIRKKALIASRASKCACEARWIIQQQYNERNFPVLTNKIFSDLKKFNNITSSLINILLDKHNAAHAFISAAIEKTGIERDQFNLAIKTLEAAIEGGADAYKPKKQESKKPVTEKGSYDLQLGELLITLGVRRKRAAIICVATRKEYPYLAAYVGDGEPVINLEKETRAVEQRLRDNGL